jgi:hypothetical protein
MVGLGDLFGFSIFSIDNAFGAASVDISNLTFCTACDANGRPPVSAVPLPPAFLLFGVALAGLGFVQKRKQLAGV